jgi:hypothetical protein
VRSVQGKKGIPFVRWWRFFVPPKDEGTRSTLQPPLSRAVYPLTAAKDEKTYLDKVCGKSRLLKTIV